VQVIIKIYDVRHAHGEVSHLHVTVRYLNISNRRIQNFPNYIQLTSLTVRQRY